MPGSFPEEINLRNELLSESQCPLLSYYLKPLYDKPIEELKDGYEMFKPIENVDKYTQAYEWFRVFLEKFCYYIADLGRECDASKPNCFKMQATEKWQFSCPSHDPPQQCSAIDYCTHALDTLQLLMCNPSFYPDRNHVSKQGTVLFTSAARRLFRIFSHTFAYHSVFFQRWEDRKQYPDAPQLALKFKCFCQIFNLFKNVDPVFLSFVKFQFLDSNKNNDWNWDMNPDLVCIPPLEKGLVVKAGINSNNDMNINNSTNTNRDSQKNAPPNSNSTSSSASSSVFTSSSSLSTFPSFSSSSSSLPHSHSEHSSSRHSSSHSSSNPINPGTSPPSQSKSTRTTTSSSSSSSSPLSSPSLHSKGGKGHRNGKHHDSDNKK